MSGKFLEKVHNYPISGFWLNNNATILKQNLFTKKKKWISKSKQKLYLNVHKKINKPTNKLFNLFV